MKIYRVAQDFNNLPVGTEVLSDIYRREGNIKLLEREEKPDPLGGTIIRYRAFFSRSGRKGYLDARDITKVLI